MSIPSDELGIALATGNQQYIDWASGVQSPVVPTGSGGPQIGTAQTYSGVQRSTNAIAAMGGAMSQYGLGSLMGKIEQWVVDGYDTDAIMALIRTTPEYDARFPAMKILAAKGRAISEAEYIAYETNAAQIEKMYGMPAGMITNKDTITKLLGGDISAKELDKRATMAASSMYQLPEEFRRAMRDGYGIDSGMLTAFFFDPDAAEPEIERKFVSGQIMSEAYLRGLDVGVPMSEMLYSLGVDREKARAGFTTVSGMTSFGDGLGETATQNELVGAAFNTDQNSLNKVVRIGIGRKGRFNEGGSFTGGNTGVSGVGTAAV